MKYLDKQGNIINSGYVGNCLEISDARVLAAEEFKKKMLLEAAKKQAAGYPDDWREKKLSTLAVAAVTNEEMTKIVAELVKIIFSQQGANFETARMETAHAGFCLAMIHDKLNSLELEAMQNNIKKSQK